MRASRAAQKQARREQRQAHYRRLVSKESRWSSPAKLRGQTTAAAGAKRIRRMAKLTRLAE